MIGKPKHIIAIEGEYQSRADILSLIQKNERVFQFLFQHNYLKFDHTTTNVAFDYVGLISFDNFLVCVLPKYYSRLSLPEETLINDFASIIKVLKKIGYSDSIPDSRNISSNESINLSELVFADKFLKDYLEYGIFNKNKDSVLLNIDGEVDWALTVSLLDPLLSRRRPIYHNVYAKKLITEEYNLITELHKWTIKHCLRKFGRILDYNFHFTEDTINDISELGSVEFIVNVLRKELSVTYSDREILLIKRLVSFIERMQNEANDIFPLFGTGYFHVVWEKACSAVFSNKADQYLSNIPYPIWNDLEGNCVAKETLKPDIVSIENGADGRFFIFDAKYYNIQSSSRPHFSVSGNPGIADVGKQYLYELAFKDIPVTSRYNCFLFPKLINGFFEVFGFVSFSLFEKSFLYNIYLSPREVFSGYLSNNQIGQRHLKAIAEIIDAIGIK